MVRRTLSLKNMPPQGTPIDMVIQPACGLCRFWNEPDWTCRRRPPYHDTEGNGTWPMIRHNQWCGEFKRLPVKADG